VRVRGLKQFADSHMHRRRLSHPVRVRGLKLNWLPVIPAKALTSHPVRVRGLKQILPCERAPVAFVAPRAGAWVETSR